MLVWVTSSDTSGMAPTPEWRREATGRILCRRCYRIDRRIYPTPIDIHLLEYADGPIVLAGFRVGIRLFRVDFIEQIRHRMSGFVFGRCYDRNGGLVERYVTAYTDRSIIVHRDKTTEYFRCKTCGIVNSAVVIFPPGYFLRRELPPGPVYQKAGSSLFLDAELADQIDWSPLPDVQLYRYDIRDTPQEGWRSPDDPGIPEWGAQARGRGRGDA